MNLAKMLAQMEGEMSGKFETGEDFSKEEQIKRIKEFVEISDKPCPFKVGDWVTQKNDSTRYYRKPAPGNPVMVLGIYNNPAFINTAVGGQAVKEDMIIAFLDSDGRVERYQVESFRFEPYKD